MAGESGQRRQNIGIINVVSLLLAAGIFLYFHIANESAVLENHMKKRCSLVNSDKGSNAGLLTCFNFWTQHSILPDLNLTQPWKNS